MQCTLFLPETVETVATIQEIRRSPGVASAFPVVATVATVGIRAGAVPPRHQGRPVPVSSPPGGANPEHGEHDPMTEAAATDSTLTTGAVRGALLPIEYRLSELETRLRFLAGYFEAANAYADMGPDMLHVSLSDCRDLAIGAREALDQAWEAAGGQA